MSPVLERELDLALPREQVFAFYADAFNLEKITPPDVRFRILTPAPIQLREGAHIDYTLTIFGLPFSWRTVISRWQPPELFVDEQERGPYRRWVHEHTFEALPEGTRNRDRVEYELPFQPLGRLAQPLVRWKLDQIFDFRQRAVRDLLRPTP